MDYKTGVIVISEFVKKTIVGYKPVNGSSDPECTHVILTLDEYDELHQRVRAAINDGKRAKEEAAHAAAVSAANAETAVKKIQEDTALKIEQLQSKVEAERAGKEYQIGLNQNFKRISRERANADRGYQAKERTIRVCGTVFSAEEIQVQEEPGRYGGSVLMGDGDSDTLRRELYRRAGDDRNAGTVCKR